MWVTLMAAPSTDSLTDALRQYRLLEPMQLEEVTRRLQPAFPDPKTLARELLQRGWLTPFQADHLLRGRGRELVLGSYVLLDKLGEGAMGEVFKARHRTLGRIAAVKVIRKERIDSPNAVRRFQREVRAAAALSHPNIVLAYDADEIDGAHLLAMEYIDGARDLARLVKETGPLPVAQACEYVRQAALGLQHACERGLVHRDIKPHNLLLGGDGKVVKILDMGIARFDQPAGEDDRSATMTVEGAVLGTADYLSPEQAQTTHTVDIRADIYSLGCTFYFLLAGRVPFPGNSLGYKLVQHRFEEPEPVEKVRPDAPPWVGQVVRTMMAKKPEDRFQTPADVAAALASGPGLDAAPTLTVEGPRPAAAAQASVDTLDSALAHTGDSSDAGARDFPYRRRRKTSGSPWLLYTVAAGMSLLAGSAALVFLLFHLPGPPQPEGGKNNPPEVGVTPPSHPDRDGRPEDVKLPPVIFENFESGTYGDWKKTGTAFGDRPSAGTMPGQQAVSGYQGKYLVNSFMGGDAGLGTLTSPEFTVRHSCIHFLIGGGGFAGKTCINLQVGGKVVRTAVGKNSELLVRSYWDVKEFKGQKATIEIVDQATGPWGHINIDDIVFSDDPPKK